MLFEKAAGETTAVPGATAALEACSGLLGRRAFPAACVEGAERAVVLPSPGRTDWTARCHRTALSNSNGPFYIQGTKQRSSVQVSVQAGEVETLGPGQGPLRDAAAIPGAAGNTGQAATQGDWGLNKGDFVSKTDALGSVARQSGESSDTKDLTAGRIHGASRDGKSGRNITPVSRKA